MLVSSAMLTNIGDKTRSDTMPISGEGAIITDRLVVVS